MQPQTEQIKTALINLLKLDSRPIVERLISFLELNPKIWDHVIPVHEKQPCPCCLINNLEKQEAPYDGVYIFPKRGYEERFYNTWMDCFVAMYYYTIDSPKGVEAYFVLFNDSRQEEIKHQMETSS